MRPRPFRLNLWRILFPITLLTSMCAAPANAGRNANGALIIHTSDAVTYTGTADYCLTSFLPASCEAAITRTDKDENTPAVIWLLAAFPDTSSPAVTTIQFGIEHNLPANEGYIEAHGKCAVLEMPDAGWPETGFGNLVSFGSTAKTELLFPFYWFAAYGFEGAYFGTCAYPSTGEAKFVDDGNTPTEDFVLRFGRVTWGSSGYNQCPESGFPDGQGDSSYPVGDNDSRFVWALHVGESVVEVRVNRFADPSYRRSFPLAMIPVKRSEWIESVPVHFRVSSTEVAIQPDGTLQDSQLTFPSPDSAANAGQARIRCRIPPEGLAQLLALQVDPSTALGWHTSPDGGITVVRLQQSTILLPKGRGGQKPTVRRYAISQPVFSTNGQCVAASAKDGRLIVFNHDGHTVFETPAQPETSFEELRFDGGCTTLSYVEESPERQASGVVDLRSGRMKTLEDVPAGVRYYSDDGTRMLIVTSHVPGAASYYDTSDAANPVALAEYSSERPIVTASVCDDGSLVALEEDEGTGQHFRVRLMNSSLLAVGDPLVTECTFQGLQFEGKFLFLGIQRHPYPAPIQSITTTDVLLFDLY